MLMASNGMMGDRFPEGLRVLVVDNDSACLKNLSKMMKKCKYQGTLCNLGQEALDLIEKSKDGFDIVISAVNLPDMDGFTFPERVGRLNVDLPVIMTSLDGETSRVMKGVQRGACICLVKPIRMKELRNIWQHVVRKRMKELKTVENDQIPINGNEIVPVKKVNMKKTRVVWSRSLHQKFLQVVDRIGLEKAGPKKILDLMGEPSLSRDNVASHWQKYRIHLLKERKKKENELKAALIDSQSGVNQNSLTLQQNNIVINPIYVAPGPSQCSGEGNEAEIRSMPMQEGERALFGETADNSMTYTRQSGTSQSMILPCSLSQICLSQMKTYFQSDYQYDHFPLISNNTGFSWTEANANSHLYSNNTGYAIGTESTTAFISAPQESPFPHYPISHQFEQILDNDMESDYGFINMIRSSSWNY